MFDHKTFSYNCVLKIIGNLVALQESLIEIFHSTKMASIEHLSLFAVDHGAFFATEIDSPSRQESKSTQVRQAARGA